MDGNPFNREPENLACLCRTCHRAHDYTAWALAFRAWLELERVKRIDAKDAARPILVMLQTSEALARCDREIAEILGRPDVVAGLAPAWLVTLGIEDWEAEKRFIKG